MKEDVKKHALLIEALASSIEDSSYSADTENKLGLIEDAIRKIRRILVGRYGGER